MNSWKKQAWRKRILEDGFRGKIIRITGLAKLENSEQTHRFEIINCYFIDA